MSFIIINNPLDIRWQVHAWDLLVMTLFIAALVNAVVQFRRGKRSYAFAFAAAFIYGLFVELAGMATVNLYIQGTFTVMFDFPSISLFAGTTRMPLQTALMYPVILSFGFYIAEALGIRSRLHAALTGGLFMVFLDAPMIIEGPLRHVVLWTWTPGTKILEYWVGWPLADMLWEATFGATFFYLMLRARPHLDGSHDSQWSTGWALALRAPLYGVATNLVGTVWLLPLTAAILLGWPQWPLAVALVATLVVVAVRALRTAQPPRTIATVTAVYTAVWTGVFAALIVDNVIYEGGVKAYIVVQTIGVIGTFAFATAPLWLSRLTPSAPDSVGAPVESERAQPIVTA